MFIRAKISIFYSRVCYSSKKVGRTICRKPLFSLIAKENHCSRATNKEEEYVRVGYINRSGQTTLLNVFNDVQAQKSVVVNKQRSRRVK